MLSNHMLGYLGFGSFYLLCSYEIITQVNFISPQFYILYQLYLRYSYPIITQANFISPQPYILYQLSPKYPKQTI